MRIARFYTLCIASLLAACSCAQESDEQASDPANRPARQLISKYCSDCHSESSKEAGLDIDAMLSHSPFDGTLVFERIITHQMPPSDAEQPTASERQTILDWLASHSKQRPTGSYRRLSRHEFVQSLNDLLGVRVELADQIPEDRGTNLFDTDRRIMLSKEQLGSYFNTAEQLLEFALPGAGFPQEQLWTTSTIKDSHETYNIYARDYKKGLLYSWTRANNGNSYSYFYDNFEPPTAAWYELTFDAAKVGDFDGDVSILVYAGKYYYADDRPQPQRLLGALSVGNTEVQSFKLEGWLYPGENVSVHCYSRHTWRQQGGNQGAYIERVIIRGPLLESWPPKSIGQNFDGLPIQYPTRETKIVASGPTALEQIGAAVSVSSFQIGMEMEKMLDRSSKTFWHTRFTPDVAKPPHYVVIANPNRRALSGLAYSTWTGGNGNGQVKAYEVSVSQDGKQWSEPIVQGTLEVMHAAEQEIRFPQTVHEPYLRFLVTDSLMLDGKSLASIGGLDVILETSEVQPSLTEAPLKITVDSNSDRDLKRVIRRFAERAFSSELSDQELEPYYRVGLDTWQDRPDFIDACRAAFKAIVCSHRFVLVPGVHRNGSYARAADLARCLWLSVPDERLLELAKDDRIDADTIRLEIDRMLEDPRTKRMIHSFCDQWLSLQGFNKVSPSLKLYPEYNDLLNHYLPLETEQYIHHCLTENLPVSRLIDSNFAILNQRLAEHYGIDGIVGQELRPVVLPQGSPRGGLLTMGSILKVTSDGFQTSPILRGAWVSKNIAGNTLSPPPPNIKAIEPNSNHATTLKEQIQEHKQNGACNACHKSIDPYGFALESFDATGQWRTRYRAELPHRGTFSYRIEGYFQEASEVDASGEIAGVPFENVVELKKVLLSKHKNIAYNLARKFFEYANGYEPSLQQRIALYRMIPENPEDCGLKDLIARVLVYSIFEKTP
jgi:hypothetical protein